MPLQNIIVLILVIAASSFMARRIYLSTRHDGTKEGCAKCDVVKEKKIKT